MERSISPEREVVIFETESVHEAYDRALLGADLVIVRSDWNVQDYVNNFANFSYQPSHHESWNILRCSDESLPIPGKLAAFLFEAGYRPAYKMLNKYRPGDSIPLHVDIGTFYEEEQDTPLGLTFLYVLDGTKTIRMHLKGDQDSGVVDIKQVPGMLMIFRASGIQIDGQKFDPIPHEVLPQNTECRTLGFELRRRNIHK